MIIIIDDERTLDGLGSLETQLYCRDENHALAVITRTWTNQWLKGSEPLAAVFFDHDLGKGGSIDPILDFLICVGKNRMPLMAAAFYAHTMNPVGTHKIMRGLSSAGYENVAHYPLSTQTAG